MSERNTKHVALVTGASAGIGKSIVRRLLNDGWTVYGAARRVAQMSDIASEGARVLALDVTDDVGAAAVVERLLADEGRIDALVNNAGYGSYGAIEDVPIEEAKRQFDVNLFGAARLIRLVLPVMRRQRSGTVVNITSMGGRIWMPIGGWYHATKHAFEVLSDALRVETRPFGIRVVVIEPGSIRSEWSGISATTLRASSKGSAYGALIEPMAHALSLNLGADPDVVARAVSKALRSRRPHRRYAVPMDANVMVFLRRWLPDWVWERLIALGLRTVAVPARRGTAAPGGARP